MASTSDFKNGLVLNLEGQLWTITEFQHVKPGKGPAFVRTTLKNVLSGKVVDKTFNAGVKVDTATVDKRDMTFLYKDGSDFVFMDGDTYDQISVPAATVGTAADYMLENQTALVAQNEGVVLYVELPASVELLVSHTDPGLQGDRSTGGTKPATLETGAEIAVPLFLNTGEKIKVDTRDGRHADLVVGVAVHEDEVRPVLVQKGHIALVDGGGVHLDTRVEGLVDDLAGQHVLQRGPHEGRAFTRLDVLELGDRPELTLEVEHEAVLEVAGRSHGCSPCCLSCGALAPEPKPAS